MKAPYWNSGAGPSLASSPGSRRGPDGHTVAGIGSDLVGARALAALAQHDADSDHPPWQCTDKPPRNTAGGGMATLLP